MNANPIDILCASLVTTLGVTPAAAEAALHATLQHFHTESHSPTVARTGLAPADYLQTAIQTPRFAAFLAATALKADGRKADARLHWEAFVQREIDAANRAHQAVPPTATLGNPDAIHRIGRRLGLSDDRTDQLIPEIVLTLAAGYPHRVGSHWPLSLTDILTGVTAPELTEMLSHAAKLADGRTEEADTELRRMLRKFR
ncbi:hypothetical protein MUU72_29930 [Streptomyces sp. RS10V-4]|uniref:hypothetical protein n=1 Tax=Streptomyces rhizoryzae TaxID=2932493 RepID=UPI002002DB63|nr:hypothetical protein [Streptomyces rhizoryzae]MCK7627266.1 hypothetical protein [Streptomyces rhizoryzae]